MSHPASLPDDRLFAECGITFTRRSGPGGQNRNKVETAVILHHRPTGLIAEANERRSQSENKEQALHRLRVKLAVEIRTPPGESTTELWRSRCKGGRIRVNPDHPDVPPLIAEALDRLSAEGMDPKAAAEALGCSTTQLVNLLKLEPQAMLTLNRHREERGLPPLR